MLDDAGYVGPAVRARLDARLSQWLQLGVCPSPLVFVLLQHCQEAAIHLLVVLKPRSHLFHVGTVFIGSCHRRKPQDTIGGDEYIRC